MTAHENEVQSPANDETPPNRRLRRKKGQGQSEHPHPSGKDPGPRGPAAPSGGRTFNRTSRHRGSGKR